MHQINKTAIAEKKTACHVKDALDVLQGKWTLRVIYHLLKNDFLRFGQLKKKMPEANKAMLTSTLKKLEAKNIVKREQFNELPLRVEYSLTVKGKKLEAIFSQLGMWWEDKN